MNAVSASPNPPRSADPSPRGDERLQRVSPLTALVRRPELGAIGGLVLVTLFFLLVADPAMFSLAGILNFMAPAAQLGILAIGAALLMIGGEYDLSLGSMVAFAGLVFAATLVSWQLPLPVA
ncbi:MAG: simple sugar transport system permease protein, partial [Pseudomonadota bacterium]|nr:simple sugar transport system permease protein [Pseudomonadota bacterium]